jgi:DNA-binding transcriptional LysR family regulator
VALAEELHFGRAAARLGLAQPPLTLQIQKLERELGYPVVRRLPRRTVLTDAGRALADGAPRLLREVHELVEHARRAGRGETGRLTVGAPPSVMLSGLPAAIRRYRDARPDVRFTVKELSTTAIAEGLTNGTIDVGLLREVRSVGGLEAEVLLREPFVAVLPEGHPLARRPRLALGHLAAEPFILFPRRLGVDFYDRLVSLCTEAGFVPNVVQEATQWQSVVTFVETGLGVSIAPACVERVRLPGVVFRRLPRARTIVSVCAPEHASSNAVAGFLVVLRDEVRARRLRPQ